LKQSHGTDKFLQLIIHTRTHTHTYIYTTHAHIFTYTHTHTHSLSLSHTHTHTYMHIHTQCLSLSHTHTHTRMCKRYISPYTGLDRPRGFQGVQSPMFQANVLMYLIRLLEQPRFSALRCCNSKALKWQMSLFRTDVLLSTMWLWAVSCGLGLADPGQSFCFAANNWCEWTYYISFLKVTKEGGGVGLGYSQLDKQEDNSAYQQLSLFLKVLDYEDRNSFLSSLLVIHSVRPVNRRMVSCDVRNGQKCHNTLPATHCSHAQAQAP
jgi:hypothetical protein